MKAFLYRRARGYPAERAESSRPPDSAPEVVSQAGPLGPEESHEELGQSPRLRHLR